MTSLPIVVFDLDDTLILTREAVFQAYRAAGRELPPEAWGRPFHEWCNDESVHRRKNELYPSALARYGEPHALLEYALRLEAPVLTGASWAAVEAVRQRFGRNLNVQLWGATRDDKVRWLSLHTLSARDSITWDLRPGPLTDVASVKVVASQLYVDDDALTRQEVGRRTGWKAVSPDEALRILVRSAQC